MADWGPGFGAGQGQGGSASGYSYLHHGNAGSDKNRGKNSWGGWNQGGRDWNEEQQYGDWQQQPWSTTAEDDDWGFDPGPLGQAAPIGWRNVRGGFVSNGSGWKQNRGGGRGGRRGNRKRPQDFGSGDARSGKRHQQDQNQRWGHFDNFRYSGGRNMNYDEGWGHGDSFGYAQGFNEWDNFGPQNWGPAGGDYYDEEAAYSYQFDFGSGYEGGYEDPYHYQASSQPKPKPERNEQWKAKVESPEDKLIFKKHRALTQIKDERKALINAVRNIMNAMRAASLILSKEAQSTATEGFSPPAETTGMEEGDGNESEQGPLPPEILIGVIRVGPAIRRILIKDTTDSGAELVAVFKAKPTREQFERMGTLITENLKAPFSNKVSIHLDESIEKIVIRLDNSECPYPIYISCTSPEYGSEVESTSTSYSFMKEHLSTEKCVESLAKIRRIRWSKQMRDDLELPVVRIFLDIASRLTGWTHLKPYPAEVLVHTVKDKLSKGVRESEISVSRVFTQSVEVLAGGLVLKGGPGLKDPCEATPTDVFSYLAPQAAEDLTKAAQMALRLIACNKLKMLLDLES